MTHPKDNNIEELIVNSADALEPGEVVIGQIHGLSSRGEPLVDFPQNLSSKAIPSMSTMAINKEHSGRQVALLFTQGDLSNPLIIGLIHSPLQALIDGFGTTVARQENDQQTAHETEAPKIDEIDAQIDGKRLVLEGREEVVLKCGDASITLTKAGKILIRGKYILNRSSGVNRILGGSVQVN